MNIFNKYKSIIIISCIGFLITGIAASPFYMVWWDNEYVFNKFIIDGNPPTNWMGWFYVYLWEALYKITRYKNIIGVLHNLLYWIAMPVIYINFFKSKSIKLYLVLVLCPLIFPFLFNITNNILVMSMLALLTALYSLFLNTKNRAYLAVSYIIMIFMIWTRRDSAILVIPFMFYISYTLTGRKFLKSSLLCFVLFTVQSKADSYITSKIPDYSNQSPKTLSIDTLGLIMLYDLTAMSFYKNELLIPDSVLKPQDRDELLKTIKKYGAYEVVYNFDVLQGLGYMLKSGTVWHSGLTFREVLPIYLQNIPYYIWLKINVFAGYMLYILPFMVLSIISMVFLFSKKFKELFDKDYREWLLVCVISGWIFITAVLLSVNGIQVRYTLNSNFIFWFAGVYVLGKVFGAYRLAFVKK